MLSTSVGKARSLNSSSAKRASVGLISSAMTIGANGLTGLIVSRSLGAIGRGQFAVVMVFAALSLTLGAVGMPEVISTRVVSPTADKRSQVIGVATWLSLPMTVLGLAAALLLGRFESSEAVSSQLIVLAFTLPLRTVALTAVFGVLAMGKVAMHQLMLTGVGVATLGFVSVAWLMDLKTIEVFAWAAVLGAVVPAVIQLGCLTMTGISRPTGPMAKTSIGFGVRSWMGSAANTANQKADLVLLAAIASPTSLGIYANAASLASLALVAPSAFGPRLRWAVAKSDRSAMRKWAGAGIIFAAGLGIVGCVGSVVFFGSVYGDGFESGRWVAGVLVLVAPLLAASRLFAIVVATSGSPGTVARAEFLGLITGVVSLLALFPFIGLWAAVVGSALGYGCAVLVEFRAAWLVLGKGEAS